jgi:hypothetical protein
MLEAYHVACLGTVLIVYGEFLGLHIARILAMETSHLARPIVAG